MFFEKGNSFEFSAKNIKDGFLKINFQGRDGKIVARFALTQKRLGESNGALAR